MDDLAHGIYNSGIKVFVIALQFFAIKIHSSNSIKWRYFFL